MIVARQLNECRAFVPAKQEQRYLVFSTPNDGADGQQVGMKPDRAGQARAGNEAGTFILRSTLYSILMSGGLR